MADQVAPGVQQIDTLLGGWERVTAGFLIEGPAPVLIETGSQTSVPALLNELDSLGVGATDLAGVVVTHIHLDHAGGVGDVAAAFPRAKVYVHEKGARHLADPTKLVNSAEMVYGELLDTLYGRLTPTEADRIQILAEGDRLEIGGKRVLTTIDSPGHAKHHLALHDSDSGVIFVGDAVGVRLPDIGVLRPATPPPDFDLNLALESIGKFRQRKPTALAFAHYGVVAQPDEILEEAEATLIRWAEVAQRAFRDGRDIAEAFEQAFSEDYDHVDDLNRQRMETLNGVHSNAAGFQRWLNNGGHLHWQGHHISAHTHENTGDHDHS